MLQRRVYKTTDADAIEVGDLLVFSSSTARPASVMTDATGLSAAARLVIVQDKVADVFLGVALQGKLAGEVKDILVAINCVAEYSLNTAVASTAIFTGEQLEADGSDNATTGTGLTQSVRRGTTNPIGRASEGAAIGSLYVTAQFRGIHADGGPVAD
jgi:hypothetical protein